jgi:hypothetical protein
LRISFIPLTPLNSLDSNQYSSLGSMVLDIQQQTSISFTIPYVSHRPWLPVVGPDGQLTPPAGFGMLRISVLNELNHPTTPVPGVYLNLWVSAGPDFQLARPTGDYLRGTWALPTTDVEETPFVAQGLTRQMIREMPAPPLIPASGSMEHEICNADEIHHVKDMIMRPCFIGTMPLTATPGYVDSAYINPFAPVQRYNLASLTPSNNQMTYLEYFRLIYRFARGGHRIVMECHDPTVNINNTYRSITNSHTVSNGLFDPGNGLQYLNGLYTVSGYATRSMKNGHMYAMGDMSSIATIPYYSTMYGTTNAGASAGVVTGAYFNQYGYLPSALAVSNSKDQVFLAAADDYELIFLVGPPAMSTLV